MTSRRVWSVLLGAVLTLAVFAPPPAAAVGTSVHLSATVTNTDLVNQDGTVCLELVGSGSCGGNWLTDGAWETDWIDAADDPANGETAGDYLIRVISDTMDGASRWYVDGVPAGTAVKDDATPVALSGAAPDLHFDMVMPAIAKVTGTVVDSDANPVAGATVFRNQLGHSRSAVTNALGVYDFGYVRSGVHSLSVNPVGDYSGASGSMTVPASGDYAAPVLTVQTASAIHGLVVDSVTGDPIPMVQVEVYTAGDHTYQGSAYTDLNGYYRVNQLGGQPLVARFTHEFGGYERKLYVAGDPYNFSGEVAFTLDPAEDRALGVLGTMPLVAIPVGEPPTHNLSGTVTDSDGNPLAGIRVGAAGLTDDVTDRLGHWYLDAPAGTYRLRVEDDGYWSNRLFDPAPGWFPEYYPNATREADALPVTVVDGGATQGNLDVTLTRGAYIEGSVMDGVGGTSNFQTHWLVYGPAGQLDSEQTYSGFYSGASYQAFVRPGTWRLLLRAQRYVTSSYIDYLPRWFGDVDSFASATPVTVTAGETVIAKDVTLDTAFSNVAPPAVTGTPAVGHVLTATAGAWTTMTLTEFATTWWRGATQVGSGASYTITAADAGSSLQARVVASNSSHTATASSTPAAVAKVSSTAVERGSSPKPRIVKLTITVSSAGPTPAGILVIRRGTKIVKSVTLVAGRTVVKLRRQPSGVRRYTASYGGSDQILPSISNAVKVRVR